MNEVDRAKKFLSSKGLFRGDRVWLDDVASLMAEYRATYFGSIPVGSEEPVFTLRAQDMMAPALVQMWISLNPQAGVEKLRDAQEILEAMKRWPKKKMAD